MSRAVSRPGRRAVMKSTMLAEQLRDLQAYERRRTVELETEPADVPDRVREILKSVDRRATPRPIPPLTGLRTQRRRSTGRPR